jgi:mRNA interferase RelE/StbE
MPNVENFTVQLGNRAEKDLNGLDSKIESAIREALLEMEIDPFGGDYKKLRGDKGHRRRVGRYRILFDIDTDLRLVTVQRIRHRKDAYQ